MEIGGRLKKIVVLLFSQVSIVLISFLFSPFLARSLSVEEFAIYGQISLISSLFTTLFTFGIFSVLLYLFQSNIKNFNNYVTALIVLMLFGGCIAGVLILLLSSYANLIFESQNIAYYFKLYSPFFIFAFINNLFSTLLIFKEKFNWVASVSIIINILNILLLIISIHFFHSFTYVILVIGIIVPLIQLIINFILCKDQYQLNFNNTLVYLKKTIYVTWPLWVTSILGASYSYGSGIIVNYLFNDGEFAVYRAGAIEIPFLSSIAYAVSTALMVDISKLYSEGNLTEIIRIQKKIIVQIAAITYPIIIFFILNSKAFITSYLSIKYENSYMIFCFYCCILFIRVNDYQLLLTISNNNKFILKSNIIYFIVNIMSITGFGLIFGVNGVAFSTMLSIFILAIILIRKSADILNASVYSIVDIKKILQIIILSFVIGVVTLLLNKYLMINNVFLKLIFSFMFFIGLIYSIQISLGIIEKELIRRLLPKFR